MPRDGSNVFSAPAGTLATSGTPIESAKYNAFVNDVVADLNLARPIVAGGTGATTAGGALTALGAQPADADLTAIAGLSSNGIVTRTGSGTAAVRTITAGAGITVTNGDGVSGNPTISASGVPAGAVMHFAMDSPPTGWLKANGALVSRTTYADLFAAIGTTFGAGDGSTTFALPDLRAEFVRGWDDARGVDSGRAFGSAQSSQNLAHSHTGSTDSAGSHTHTFPLSNALGISNTHAGRGSGTNDSTLTTSSSGAHTHTLTINNDGGTEARPRNIALLACIKT